MAEEVFHIGIKALVINTANQILLLHEIFPDGNSQWDMPGGRMEPNETFVETLRRELSEEIGVEEYLTADHFATTLSGKRIKTNYGSVALALVIFRVRLKDNTVPKSLEPGVELHWKELDDAKKLLLDKYPIEFVDKLNGKQRETIR